MLLEIVRVAGLLVAVAVILLDVSGLLLGVWIVLAQLAGVAVIVLHFWAR